MLTLDKQNDLRERVRQLNPDWMPATERYAQLVRNGITPTSTLLDVGCGRGGLVEQLGHPLHLVTGIDPDFESLAEHRLPLPRLQSLGNLPFVDAHFDVAMASWVLEHWDNPLVDLQEIGRVLKSGGRFIFITPNAHHPLLLLNQLLARTDHLQKKLVATLYGRAEDDTFPIRYQANTPEQINYLAQKTGFEVEQLIGIDDPTYLAFHPALLKPLTDWEKRRGNEGKLHLVGCLRKR